MTFISNSTRRHEITVVYRHMAVTALRQLLCLAITVGLFSPYALLARSTREHRLSGSRISRRMSSSAMPNDHAEASERLANRSKNARVSQATTPPANMNAAATSTPCSLYPIALHAGSVEGVSVGGVIDDIYNGAGSGDFGWLTWTGNRSVPALVKSLTPPGDSNAYVNPDDGADHEVSAGDWVRGKPGVSNSSDVRDALDTLITRDIIVPVWDQARGRNEGDDNGGDPDRDQGAYHVSAFAQVRLLSYHLPGQNRISARFLGFTSCSASLNHPPIVDAGPDQTVTLPDSAQLNGTVSDDGFPTGSTVSVNWSQVSGPGTVSFTSPHAATTAATFSAPGTYELRLTASDSALTGADQVTIIARKNNDPPLVNAGMDQAITLPQAATLQGSVSDDGLPPGSALTVSWSEVSGPAAVTFAGANSPVTTATFGAPGVYVLRLTASDSQLTAADDVTVTVNPANQSPAVDAGPDQTIMLPEMANLNGSISDDGLPAGAPVVSSWSMVNGPGSVTFGDAGVTVTTATFSAPGTYVLRLSASDSQLSGSDELTVIVHTANEGPTANAGADQTIIVSNSAQLNGTATDDGRPAGSALSISWSRVAGPGTVAFSSPHTAATAASFSAAGIYVLRLTANDSQLTSSDDVAVTVNAANQPPVVNAGSDQSIILPNGAGLNGTVSDDGLPGGTPTNSWSVVSGPGVVTFDNPQATVTAASFSAPGTYLLRLTSSDSQLTATDEMTVTVEVLNQAPTAHAGADQTVTLGGLMSLNGSVSDDGLPAGSTLATSWSQVSGPGTVSFGSAGVSVTTAGFSAAGTYVLRLAASDSELTGSDEVSIEVVAPVVDLAVAGVDTGGLLTDAQTQVTGGTVRIDVTNRGSDSFSGSFEAIVFEDVNRNGTYQSIVDRLLGVEIFTGSIDASGMGSIAPMVVPVSGVLSFSGNSIHAFVDSALQIAETNETNNVGSSGQASRYQPPVNQFQPKVKWVHDPADGLNVSVGPFVAPLIDTNGDESINERDIPAVIYRGTFGLRALRGDTGALIWEFRQGAGVLFTQGHNPAIGDLDGDGVPEVLMGASGGWLYCFNNNGTLRWTSTQINATASPTIVDLDGDGRAEILSGTATFNFDGTVRRALRPPGHRGGQIAAAAQAADLDLDGVPEIIAGPSASDRDGNPIWSWQAQGGGPYTLVGTLDRGATTVITPNFNFLVTDGYTAIANLDNDLNPEVIVVCNGGSVVGPGIFVDTLWVFEHDGRIKTGFPIGLYQGIFNQEFYHLGPPTVADFDGDGQPEIAISAARGLNSRATNSDASQVMMAVYERDGSLKWRRILSPAEDRFGHGTSPAAAFDLDGDGAAEIVYQTSRKLHILNGRNGETLYEIGVGRNGITASVNPAIADVDNDGVAEIVVVGTSIPDGSPLRTGILVLGDTSGNWRNSRRVWNQWLYHVTNIEENARIPLFAANNWETLNSSRAQTSVEGADATAAPDLTVSNVTISTQGCPASLNITARIGNGGSLHVGPGQTVRFYDGDPAAGGTLIGTQETKCPLPPNPLRPDRRCGLFPGEFEDVTLTGIAPPGGQVFVTVNEPPVETLAQSSNLAQLPHTWALASGVCPSCSILSNIFVYRGIDGVNFLPWLENFGGAFLGNPPFYEVRFQFPVNATSVTVQNANAFNTGFLTGTLDFSNGFSTPFTFNANGEGTINFPEQQNVSWVRLTGATTRSLGASLSEFIIPGSYTEPQFRIKEGTGRGNNNKAASGVATCDPSVQQPPFIASAPPITATVGTAYSYQVQSGDLNNDPLSFLLLNGPAGMTMNSAGLITWTPLSGQTGNHTVTVQVADNRGGTTEQSFSIRVRLPNQAPIVNAGADQTITQNNPALLNATATDDGLPAGAPLTASWTVVSGPGTVSFASANAVATSATFGQVGAYVLRLTVSDSLFTVNDEININVTATPANQPPVVHAGADQTVTLPNDLILFSNVNDDGLPTGSTVTSLWSQVSGPGTVTFIPGLANTVTASFSAPGNYLLRLTASDSQLSASDDIAVQVIGSAGNQAPTVNAGADQQINLPNTAALSGTVADDGLPSGSTLAIMWSQVSGPGTVSFGNPGQASTSATFGVSGTYVLRLSVSDSQLDASDDIQVIVFEPITGPPPAVSINSPADGAEITSRVDITGTISNGNWRLEYGLNSDDGSDNQPWTMIASGNSPVTNGLLGSFDPTLLLNGIYGIRLVSTDAAGQTSVNDMSAVVTGNQKVGNFSLSFIDLDVPVAGLPIQVIRSYDSRDKRNGDFGVGWTLGIKNVRVEKSGKLGRNWEQTRSSGFFPNYCLRQTRPQTVTITFADGKVYKFQPVATPQCRTLTPIQFTTIGFQQAPSSNGTQGATLEALNGNEVIVSGSVPGSAELLDLDTFNPFNPTLFKLTTAEGFEFIIDQQAGVRSMTDRNANTLTINSNGITHSSGKSVIFTRDPQGRITSITDPAGKSMIYGYDSNGDLVSFTDREINVTTFGYNDSHGLLTINDPRGIQPIRNEYDSDGRLIRHTDALGKVISYNHDLNARQEIITDRLGNVTLHEYDVRGNILRTTDAEGGVTTLTYDSRDNKLSETNAVGQTSTFAYNARDKVVSHTDPLGSTSTLTYSARNQLLSVTDPLGRVLSVAYNANGNLLTQTDPLGNITRHTYDTRGNHLTTTDALGNVTTFAYDAQDNQIRETDARGIITDRTYDASGNLLAEATTRVVGGAPQVVRRTFAYDASNRVIETTDAEGGVTRISYTPTNKEASRTDPLGHVTTFEYDELDRLVRSTYPDGASETTAYDAENRKVAETDRAGRTTRYAYDRTGRLVTTTFPDGATTHTAYDAVGRATTETDENGNAVLYLYDALGRNTSIRDPLNGVTALTYDRAGRVTARTDRNGRATSFVYDAGNRRIRTDFPDGTTASATYDAAGRQLTATDQAANSTTFQYDALGDLVQTTNALGHLTRFVYDELRQLVSHTDPLGNVTRFGYDRAGRQVTKVLPMGQAESRAYDAAGNLTELRDFNGATTTYTYDNLNRPLRRTLAGGETLDRTYTPTGQIATLTDARGLTRFAYDQRDRPAQIIHPGGAELRYAYDAKGNRTAVTTPGGTIDYTYDAGDRLVSLADPQGRRTTYSYDPQGNRTGASYANGVATSYSYDLLNRLIGLTHRQGATTLRSFTYTLGAAGNRTRVVENTGRMVDYTYDRLFRLTEERIADPATGATSANYSYDANGNRTNLATPAGTASYSYDANGRVLSAGGITFSYDANGNTLSKTESIGTTTYAYDGLNRLTRAAAPGGALTRYSYDGLDNRVQKVDAAGAINYLIDPFAPSAQSADRQSGNCGADSLFIASTLSGAGSAPGRCGGTAAPAVLPQVMRETDATGAVLADYVYGHDLVSMAQQGNVSFLLPDGQMSTRLLTDTAGTVTDTYDYDAFGNLLARTGVTPNQYLFTGQQLDPNVGFYYLRARYYQPDVGRFLTRDPFPGTIFDPQSLHAYTYAHNDPVNNSDPTGLYTLLQVSIAIGIVTGLIAMGVALAYDYSIGEALIIGVIVGAIFFGLAYFLIPVLAPGLIVVTGGGGATGGAATGGAATTMGSIVEALAAEMGPILAAIVRLGSARNLHALIYRLFERAFASRPFWAALCLILELPLDQLISKLIFHGMSRPEAEIFAPKLRQLFLAQMSSARWTCAQILGRRPM